MKKSVLYYEENHSDFFEGWSEDHFHYGLWYEDTLTHEESLLNLSKSVISNLNIQSGDRILDAGCGTGGTGRYIIDNYDASVVGIMLPPTLLEKANEFSNKSVNKDRISFQISDYNNTGFGDDSFHRIY